MPDFDVIVIGSGPGGYSAAIRAAQLGLKTACVEKGPKAEWGGTCLHWGCIPTKALLHDAYLFDMVKKADKFGIELQNPTVNLAKVMAHKDLVVKRGFMGVDGLLRKYKVTQIVGYGKVVKPGVVDGNTTQVDGINPGDVLANSSFDKLQDNAKVVVSNKPVPSSSPAGSSAP